MGFEFKNLDWAQKGNESLIFYRFGCIISAGSSGEASARVKQKNVGNGAKEGVREREGKQKKEGGGEGGEILTLRQWGFQT